MIFGLIRIGELIRDFFTNVFNVILRTATLYAHLIADIVVYLKQLGLLIEIQHTIAQRNG